MSKAAKAKEEESKEEEKPKTAEAPPRAERYEKQEKGEKHEKHEKHEKQEKHEKEAPEKHEKHEKTEIGIWGSIIAGILVVALGVVIFLVRWHGIPELWWPIFLVMVGIAIIVYAIIATSAMRRSPQPPA